MKFLATTLLVLLLSQFCTAENRPADVSDLDFWIGEWEVSWKDEDGNVLKGKNTITRILDGKVIKEDFDASEAINFTGSSFSVLDSLTGEWKQTWVDSNGSYMDFEGYHRGDAFVFRRSYTNAKGEDIENRMVFRMIEANSFIWDWEGRKDPDGQWNLLWRLHYTRLPVAPETPQNVQIAD